MMMTTTTAARKAHTCLGKLDLESLDQYNLKEAQQKAVRRDIPVTLTPEECRLFETLENAAIAFETKSAPFDDLVCNHEQQQQQQQQQQVDDEDGKDVLFPEDLSEPIEIRIAGGWVRDKLMNQSSHDVDIALNSLSGRQFAHIVQRYLVYVKEKAMALHPESDEALEKRPKVAVIAANPSQSKHLETATMTIHNMDCDFVHLRGGEVYAHDSRIPTLKETATPLDDALRRDFTVNSLFYNLRQRYVEDWTGRGISDLIQDKILVTPLDASITFHDDPLRVLRAVRFAVRYDLELSPEIKLAAMSPTVHESLHVKVSRERVGKELEGMLMGKNARPCVALKLITDLKLAGCVFEFPHLHDDGSPPSMMPYEVKGCLFGVRYDHVVTGAGVGGSTSASTSASKVTDKDRACAREKSWEEAAAMLQFCGTVLSSFQEQCVTAAATTATTSSSTSTHTGHQQTKNDSQTHVDHRLFYLSTFLYPLRNMICVDSKGKEIPLPAYIVRDSIKFPNRDTAAITTVLKHVDELRWIIFRSYGGNCDNHVATNQTKNTLHRLEVGLMLRNLKELWVTTLLVACVAEIHSQQHPRQDSDSDVMEWNTESSSEIFVGAILEKAFEFFKDIHRHGLDGCWKSRPLLDGKAILQSLNLPRGPMVGKYLEEQMKWMLMNPKGTRDECEQHLKQIRKRDLESVVASSVSTTTTTTTTSSVDRDSRHGSTSSSGYMQEDHVRKSAIHQTCKMTTKKLHVENIE